VAAPSTAATPSAVELEEVDVAMQKLADNKAAWASAPLQQRINILKEIRARLLDQVT
jgi:acyl-CoA reductase-like NAD-dependent aldehyde dehydrogenase